MGKFLLLISLFCANAIAGNYIAWPTLSTAYATKEICLTANPSGDCLAIPDGSIPQVLEKITSWESASQVSACSGESDCQVALASLTCEGVGREKFINEDFSQVYCTKNLGSALSENSTVKTSYLSAKAASDALETGLKEVTRLRSAGQRVISLVILINGQKSLTNEQVIALHSTYAVIKAFLEDGSLDRARAAVVAATPDGVIMTQGDKDAILAEIDLHI